MKLDCLTSVISKFTNFKFVGCKLSLFRSSDSVKMLHAFRVHFFIRNFVVLHKRVKTNLICKRSILKTRRTFQVKGGLNFHHTLGTEGFLDLEGEREYFVVLKNSRI